MESIQSSMHQAFRQICTPSMRGKGEIHQYGKKSFSKVKIEGRGLDCPSLILRSDSYGFREIGLVQIKRSKEKRERVIPEVNYDAIELLVTV